jgi:hypothetical protein
VQLLHNHLVLLLLQAYEQEEQKAQQQLAEQQQQFEAAVADILGIPAGQQQAVQLAEAVQEQQQLQEAAVSCQGCWKVHAATALLFRCVALRCHQCLVFECCFIPCTAMQSCVTLCKPKQFEQRAKTLARLSCRCSSWL